VLEGDEARTAVAEAGRRTTSRRDLARHDGFLDVSPEVGQLDEGAFDELMASDPDEALVLLTELTGATDQGLRRLAEQLAGRIVVEVARNGVARSSGVGRIVHRRGSEGELDLDRSLDEVVAARRAGTPPDPSTLTTTSWSRRLTSLCLLVDRSGSMTGERLAAAAVAAAAVCIRHPERCAVVSFGDEAIVLASPGDPRDPDDVVADLLRLRGHGTTDVGLALRTARRQLGHMPAGRHLTVLLSDCRSTAGDPAAADAAALDELVILAPEDDPADARHLADAAGARCIPVGRPSDVAFALAEALDPGSA
jgi:Mg-chelatase subunit ChlD